MLFLNSLIVVAAAIPPTAPPAWAAAVAVSVSIGHMTAMAVIAVNNVLTVTFRLWNIGKEIAALESEHAMHVIIPIIEAEAPVSIPPCTIPSEQHSR